MEITSPSYPLSDSDQHFVNSYKHVQTPLGIVVRINMNIPIPPGWRKMTILEGKKSHCYLNNILQTWSIVAFLDGKLDGCGYGNKFHDNFGNQCGQIFLVKQ